MYSAGKQIGGPLILLGIVLLCQVIGFDHLAYDAQLIGQHQYWRLLTANWVHLNLVHMLLNAAGICALWLLHGEYYRPTTYIGIIIISGLSVTLGLLILAPHLSGYVGLSGVLHGLFAWGLGKDFESGKWSAWLLTAGLLLKLTAEAIFGADPGISQLIGAPVATEAHLLGATSGGLLAILTFLFRSENQQPTN